MVSKKSWLITGGCGFIGRNLLATLLAEGQLDIRILDNLSIGSKKDLLEIYNFREIDMPIMSRPVGVELLVGDVCNLDDAYSACKGIDIVIHLAGNSGVQASIENPHYDCQANVVGTLNMLESSRKNRVSRFVFASSSAPLGEQEPPIHEKKVPMPVSPYGASKLACEAYCSAYYRSFGLETVVLRFGNVYGPLSTHKSSVVAKFIKKAFREEALEIYGDGQQTRDFIYVSDLIRSIRLAAEVNCAGEIFQIATHNETPINELVQLLIQRIEEAKPKANIQVQYASRRKGDITRNYSDISKAREILGFEPEVDLHMGLKKTIDWFISSNKI